MLENIKSLYAFENILKYIKKKDILNIFRYNKVFQTKLGITKKDYLYEYCDKIPEINLMLSRDIFKERKGVRGVIELFKSLNKDISKKKILKENIIEYIALQEDFCLSIDHIFFKQIIKKKIELGIKNIKIRINMEEEYLSYEDISDFETDKRKMFKDKNLEKYIKHKIKLINKCIKNLEFLLNNDIAISEFYYKIEDIENKYVSNKGNYMDDSFKDTENNDLKNFVINFLSKRVELINKIIEKNCKNIIKMDYLVFYRKPNKEDKFAFPL